MWADWARMTYVMAVEYSEALSRIHRAGRSDVASRAHPRHPRAPTLLRFGGTVDNGSCATHMHTSDLTSQCFMFKAPYLQPCWTSSFAKDLSTDP